MTPNFIIYAPILVASLLLFSWSCYRKLSLVTVGKPEDRFQEPGQRLMDVLLYAFGQKRVMARPFGFNHAMIFWAFIILLIANGEFLLSGLFPAVSLAVLPEPLHHALLFAFDAVSGIALVCVALAACRRLFFAPDYMETSYTSPRSLEAFMILGSIALLMLAYFGLHGTMIAMGKETAVSSMPVSSLFAQIMAAAPSNDMQSYATFFWWLHAMLLLLFMNYLPHSKHMHILTAMPNCFFKSLKKPNTQIREEFVKGESFGTGSVDQLSWKDLLDGFSCTECGRCQSVCPAVATGKPLNPRKVVHDIKMNLLNGSRDQNGFVPGRALIGDEEGSVSEDAIWSCTTCGACMSACPVFIEQMPKIVKMRRHLVQMKSSFPEELLNLFENMEGRSNPWGIAPTDRTKWYSTLDVKPFDAHNTEYLLYVGCAGTFDSRQKHVTVALATILDSAGVSWGILGKEELCCGDSLRRLGNEFVFDRMAKQNVQLLKEKGVKKIVTQCPHCFNTLKNDYQQYGLEVEVLHHSQLIEQLIADGKLKLPKKAELGKIIFHDSCYLGRHNDTYEAPRQVIQAATGTAPSEFDRSKENGFCCGAGGGRMWMEELSGTRINIERVKEALQQEPDTLCVSCPYCMTMMEDGLKEGGIESVRIRDIAEVVAEAMS